MISVVRITVSFGVILACASALAAAQAPVPTPAAAVQASPAGGAVNISPKRLVFADKDRGATVVLFNSNAATTTYAIELADQYMDERGSIHQPTDAKPMPAAVKSAKSMISFTPRRITLGPGQSQIVRIRVQRPASLAAGEYRTHLAVTNLPPEDAGLTAQQAVDPGRRQFAIRVIARYRITIPLIVRQGPADVQAKIASTRFIPQQENVKAGVSAVDVELARDGASSLFGDVEVHATTGKKSELVGRVRGAAVYPELQRRTFRVSLARPVQRDERLSVTYRDDDTRPGQPIAKADVPAR